MTTFLGKSCSFGLPRVPFVNCRQFMYLVISLLVLRAGCGIWLYQFLTIAYLFTLCDVFKCSAQFSFSKKSVSLNASTTLFYFKTAFVFNDWLVTTVTYSNTIRAGSNIRQIFVYMQTTLLYAKVSMGWGHGSIICLSCILFMINTHFIASRWSRDCPPYRISATSG